ncbi:UDP-N-acetylglucosamine 1-carboxyvinyltransferase [Thermosporothrix hazakensis]|jgi:UDP-N-acetylglucosamine 1-carboxyvinyltransferase|uniref:UDP-N-acetylglucosamine 1-carboxyvinyltransferase n=2 Tax=Thermosporothrix TaxID=768650 RepID=A0A326UNV1_THEHA|nr:UDP-N-acetylglucosamine 1-carboxyvinyltransferase [Thermosporothrix hazakensis]PZW31952.1 UDP-N-acetylglucosamine 1-carboxyvinyltransferase [Thermosporothrix hazakensis]BBH91577.1 UDP-N-acetylglucosamine 1-carboxyvinyltransferase 1 [Thermosporothrix sp. COM3]GCE49723.1 UDP-N-acetylglucosamine 1-carboxyvinyltransferase 1 [Thermosporothrix hazakensis]
MKSFLDTLYLAELLKAKRGERGLREVAEEIGNVSPATLSRVEHGKMVDVETFLQLCDWLRVAPQQFIKEAPYGVLSSQAVRYTVQGGQRLEGSVVIQGAKNAALPIIAASLLARKGQTILRNVPLIRDIFAAISLARELGAKVTLHEEDQVLIIDASDVKTSDLPAQFTELFRGSILFLAPVLARTGKASIATVGGCRLGKRRLDFHYRGFARLGAEVTEDNERISMKMQDYKGAYLYLDTPSHTGTENLMMAACLAEGETTIENAALEPEIADVAHFLNLMGARISGIGTGVLHIEGVKELSAVEYTIMPDRLDAGSMAMVAAATQGDVALVGANLRHLGVIRAKLEQMGVEFWQDGSVIRVRRTAPLRPVNVITWPYPGYPTDLQPQIMALSCLAEGRSYLRETLFEERFSAVQELQKMGATIEIQEGVAVVSGVAQLRGTQVTAHDIRAGTALIIAAATAEGETVIDNAWMIERGCSAVVRRLSQLGLSIQEEREYTKLFSALSRSK